MALGAVTPGGGPLVSVLLGTGFGGRMGSGMLIPAASDPFPPISGLIARWESDQIPVVADFDPVPEWPDQSGNNHDLVQSNADRQPFYMAEDADFNGQPSVEFDGTDDVLSVMSGMPTGTTAMEYLFVAKRVGTPVAGWPYSFTRSDAEQGGGVTTAGSSLYFLSCDAATFACQVAWPTTPFLDDAIYTNNTAGASHRVDDGAAVTGNVGTINATWTAAFHIGAFRQFFGFFPIKVAAMFYVRPSMSSDDRAALRSYISEKYGVTV